MLAASLSPPLSQGLRRSVDDMRRVIDVLLQHDASQEDCPDQVKCKPYHNLAKKIVVGDHHSINRTELCLLRLAFISRDGVEFLELM